MTLKNSKRIAQMQTEVSFLRYLVPFVLVNHFYVSPVINYKVVFIAGVVFLVSRFNLKALITLLLISILQVVSIVLYSSDVEGGLVYFFQTFLMSIGLFGWARRGFEAGMLRNKPSFFLILGLASLLFSSEYAFYSASPLVLFLLLVASRENKGSMVKSFDYVFFVLFSLILSWRAALIGFLGGFAFYVYTSARASTRILLLLFGVVVAWLLYKYLMIPILNLLIATGTSGDLSSGRIAMFYVATELYIESLINLQWGAFFGFGLNSTASIFTDTLEVNFSFSGIDFTSVKQVINKDRLHLHNFAFQTVFEFGLIGLVGYLFLVIMFFKHSRVFSLLTMVGLVSGALSGTFYMYSSYFIIMLALYYYQRRRVSQANLR